MIPLWQETPAAFDKDFVVLGVMAQLFAGLFLASAAGKGRPRHLLLEVLGGTPRNLDFLRDALVARVRGTAGAIFLLAGAALLLGGFLIEPGPDSVVVRVGGIALELVVVAAFMTAGGQHAERTLRRYVRQFLQSQPFAFEDHIALTREIGELYGVPSSGEDTLEGYVKKVRAAVGLPGSDPPTAAYRRPRPAMR